MCALARDHIKYWWFSFTCSNATRKSLIWLVSTKSSSIGSSFEFYFLLCRSMCKISHTIATILMPRIIFPQRNEVQKKEYYRLIALLTLLCDIFARFCVNSCHRLIHARISWRSVFILCPFSWLKKINTQRLHNLQPLIINFQLNLNEFEAIKRNDSVWIKQQENRLAKQAECADCNSVRNKAKCACIRSAK